MLGTQQVLSANCCYYCCCHSCLRVGIQTQAGSHLPYSVNRGPSVTRILIPQNGLWPYIQSCRMIGKLFLMYLLLRLTTTCVKCFTNIRVLNSNGPSESLGELKKKCYAYPMLGDSYFICLGWSAASGFSQAVLYRQGRACNHLHDILLAPLER